MTRVRFIVLYFVFSVSLCLCGEKTNATEPDEYRTVDKAITTTIRPGAVAGQTGYLGAALVRDSRGQLVVEEVQPNSPAARAGMKAGDVVTRVGDHAVQTVDAYREWLQANGPTAPVNLTILRDDQPITLTATLAATSRPMKVGAVRVFLGLELGEVKEGEGVRVARVNANSPAAAAGLKDGELLVRFDGREILRGLPLNDILAEKRPGDPVAMVVLRDGKEVTLTATLTVDVGSIRDSFGGGRRGDRGPGGGRGGPIAPGGDTAPTTLWKKDLFRLAVIGIEFPDVKHSPKMPIKDWNDSFFSRGSYAGKMNNAGQLVFGSLNDYFHELSAGKFRLEGKVFEWIEVGKKRRDYIQGSGTSNKSALLVEALEKLSARDGKDALKDFDGIAFIYAGDRYQTNRGAVYYPHAGTITTPTKRMPYLLGFEGGSQMTPIGGFAKEFGRVLGLPDLAARPENAGSEGLSVWCAMSNPLPGGRPQHMSAWCKEKLGWIQPAVVDPTVKQKIILAPKECLKVLVRPDGSEYFLLENRRKKGFDTELPGEGLLIWRVVNDRPILEESHGIEGPTGPTVHSNAVPFPSAASTAFTPITTPSSKSPLGGGLPVYISEIRRMPDGRIAFHIGYEFD